MFFFHPAGPKLKQKCWKNRITIQFANFIQATVAKKKKICAFEEKTQFPHLEK